MGNTDDNPKASTLGELARAALAKEAAMPSTYSVERMPFHYRVRLDAGQLREALVCDLALWLELGFVRPQSAARWHLFVGVLGRLAGASHNELVDDLYTDAAHILDVDPGDVVRLSELP